MFLQISLIVGSNNGKNASRHGAVLQRAGSSLGGTLTTDIFTLDSHKELIARSAN
jgi:hypothetical protein